jgi:hypothetical protein
MRIVETLPISDRRCVCVCEHNGQFTVERRCAMLPDEVVSRHSGFTEASQAAADEVDRAMKVSTSIAPLLAIMGPRLRSMGLEGAIEHMDEVGRKLGKFIPEREVTDDL